VGVNHLYLSYLSFANDNVSTTWFPLIYQQQGFLQLPSLLLHLP
jgi:hypothetical protein